MCPPQLLASVTAGAVLLLVPVCWLQRLTEYASGCAVFTSPIGKEILVTVVAITILPVYLEARKSLVPKDQQEEPFRPFPFLNQDI